MILGISCHSIATWYQKIVKVITTTICINPIYCRHPFPPFLMKHCEKFQDASLLILRLIIAAIFIYAGYAKFSFWSTAPEGMPAGMVNLMKFLSIVEPLGGVALVAGFLTCWAAAGLGIIMVGAIGVMQFMMHTGFMTDQGPGWAFPLMILGACLVLKTFGPGSWSVDAKWKCGGR